MYVFSTLSYHNGLCRGSERREFRLSVGYPLIHADEIMMIISTFNIMPLKQSFNDKMQAVISKEIKFQINQCMDETTSFSSLL